MLYYIINKYHFGSFIIVFSDPIAYDYLNKHGNGKTWEYRISLWNGVLSNKLLITNNIFYYVI